MKKMQKRGLTESGESEIYDGKMWKICGISFFGSQSRKLLKILSVKKYSLGTKIWVTTVNPEFVMAAMVDKKFADIIDKSNIKVVDGIGLIWAKEVLKSSKGFKRWWRALTIGIEILGGKRREGLISGADLMVDLCKIAVKKNVKVFFLGGWKNRAQESGKFLAKKFPGLKYDYCQGEPVVNNDEVIKKVNKFRPEYLFVAYGMKRQEEWIERNLPSLNVKVVMGVGRSFDYYSGALKRAPKWVRMMGFEWLYSLFKEPKRWKRQLVLPKFIWMVMNY